MPTEALTSSANRVAVNANLKIELGLIFALFLLVGIAGGSYGVILPNLLGTYQLNKANAGIIFIAGTGGYIIAALSGSWLSGRFGLRNFIIVGLVLFGIASLGMWFLPPLALVLFSRLLLGLAVAIMETGANFYVTALPRNTALLNYLHAFFGVGALLGPLVTVWIINQQWGWNSVFLVLASGALVLGAGFWLVFGGLPATTKPATVTTIADEPLILKEATAPKRNPMATALRHPTVWLAVFFLLMYVGVESVVGTWSFTYLTEGQRFAPEVAGLLVSIYWLGLTAGRFGLGWVAAWAERAGRDRLLIISCIILSIVGAISIWLAGGQLLVIATSLFVIGFSYAPLYPTTLAVLSRIVAPKLVSSAIGLITGLSIVGVTLFPWLAGILLEGLGLGVLYPYVIGLSLLMLGLGILLLRPAAKDAH